MTTTNPASPFGPIAEQEFVAAAEAHKPFRFTSGEFS
jgi:hypothetical protein